MRDPSEALEIGRLLRRADFLRVAKGKRWHTGAMTVQMASGTETDVRIGFTLTRKVGNAVIRNRTRRRLKEAVRLCNDLPVQPCHDYVIVGRIEAARMPFEALKQDLAQAIRGVHANGRPGRPRSGDRRSKTNDAAPKRTRLEP